MILIDASSMLHRFAFGATKDIPDVKLKDGKYVTEDFIGVFFHYFISELVNVQMQHKNEFGELVILFDYKGKDSYWRYDVFANYKASRKNSRDTNKINYSELYTYYDELKILLTSAFPWKCLEVNRAEADDTTLILAKQFSTLEKVLIYSPDKDMLQAQKHGNVYQYSPLTKKWMVPEHKHDDMEHWMLEHVILGDSGDGVPKVVDHCEFSNNFKNHLKSFGIQELEPYTFKASISDKHYEALKTYKTYKKNRKGEDTIIDLYEDVRFGPAALQKELGKFDNSIEKWLDSHPLYRKHYERNRILVLEEGIPEYVWKDTLESFCNAKTETNSLMIREFAEKHSLFNMMSNVSKILGSEELSIDNCGWL